MEIEDIEELIDFIQGQEKSEEEDSLDEKLEMQKTLLLKKQKLEDFQKLTEATKIYSDQQELTNRQQLERANATKKLFNKIDQMKIEVQRLIDRSMEQMFSSAQEQSWRFHQMDEHREKKRLQINELRGQLERYEEIAKHIRESRGQAMLRAAKTAAKEEARKLKNVRSERDKLSRVQSEKKASEWEEDRKALVEIASLWMQVKMKERENEAIEQNNDLVKAEIAKIKQELEQQRILEIEKAKRQEEESNQRALMPIKISQTDMSMFKDPNDFPSITTKIEASRRSYENIFKRPEYMELKKFTSDKRVKLRKQERTALANLNRDCVKTQLAVIVPRLKIDDKTQSKEVVSATESEVGSQSTNMVVDQPSMNPNSSVEQPVNQTDPKVSSSKKPIKPSKLVATSAIRRQKLKPEKLDFTEIPTPSKKIKIVEKCTPTPKKRANSNVLELTKENVDSMLSSIKRSKMQQSPITVEPPPKPKKVTIDPKPIHIPEDKEPFAPSAPSSPNPSLPNEEPEAPPSPVCESAVRPSPEQADGVDSNSGGSSPPRQHPEAFDGVSLGGSISSLELNERDSVSDLGFDLSPVGSYDESGADRKRAGSSSPGAGLDFDFLNENSPAKVTSQKERQSKKPAASAKSSGGFDFGGDDSGAFDFF